MWAGPGSFDMVCSRVYLPVASFVGGGFVGQGFPIVVVIDDTLCPEEMM